MVVEESVPAVTSSGRLHFADELDASSLRALASGDLVGIWHKAYCEASHCQATLRAIRLLAACDDYSLTDDLQCIGTSIGEAHASAEKECEYFDEAANTTRLVRDVVFSGNLSPLDRLRLELDELWPAGSSLARRDRRPMLPGVIRRWPPGGTANPHMDRKNIKLLRHLGLTRRIAANIYLKSPPDRQGGLLELWDLQFTERDYEALKRSDYGLDRERIGPPARMIHPGMGDLVLFDAARIHGVEGIKSGERVAIACFIGVRDLDDPLCIFA